MQKPEKRVNRSIELTSSTFCETDNRRYRQNFHYTRIIHFWAAQYFHLYRKIEQFFRRSCFLLTVLCVCVCVRSFGCRRNSVMSSALLARVIRCWAFIPLLPLDVCHYYDFQFHFMIFVLFIGHRSTGRHVYNNDLFEYRKRTLWFLWLSLSPSLTSDNIV